MSTGPGIPRTLGKGTVSVVDVSTQTPGLAEELWEAKNQYPQGGKTNFRLPTPTLFPTRKGVYDQLQELLGRIKVAKEKINELKTVIKWQQQTYPTGYDQTLVHRADEWHLLLKAAEDEWWELNFPDPARRAQERLALNYQRTGIQEGLGGPPRSKPPPPPGPPPPLELVDPPEIYEILQAARAALAGAQGTNRVPVSANVAGNGTGGQVTQLEQQGKKPRASINERLQIPVNSGSEPPHTIPGVARGITSAPHEERTTETPVFRVPPHEPGPTPP